MTVFDITGETTADRARLSGAVLTTTQKERAVDAAEQATARPVTATEVTVLEDRASPRTTTVPVASAYSEPDDDAERVTQVLYGTELTAFDSNGGWQRVRTPDGYVTWVERTNLTEPSTLNTDAVLLDSVETGDGGIRYAGTDCRVLDERMPKSGPVSVRFRTGEERSLPADSVRRLRDEVTGEDVVAAARRYLGTEYVWGGMTDDGIDCSGLTWTAYRQNGITLPRDADMQRRMGDEVARDELEAGDLLFFPGHVALSLGGSDFVHAYGDAGEVIIQSFDVDDDNYNEALDKSFELATRLL